MKYKYQSVFSRPLELKQLFNQVRSKKISVLEFFKKSLILIFIKIKKSIPRIFIAETKTIYSSLSIGTMIMTLLSYHYLFAANFPFTTFFISCLIAYLVVKTYLQLNKWGGRESNHLEIWIPLYLLFLSYAITIQSFVVSRFITLTYGVLPETFTNVVNYVSRMAAFQDSLVVILFPLLLLMLNFSKKFLNNTKWELLWVVLSSYFAIIFIFVAVLSKWDTVFFKPYEYWIEKHSFVNIVH